MHDPMTVAFQINISFTGKKNEKGAWDKYPEPFITIWHVDPEKDGSDDSCGWFIRSRHTNQEVLQKIIKEFIFEWQYLFDLETLYPKFSATAITLTLYRRAAYTHFKNDWTKTERYISPHLADIIWFAENPVDSLFDSIVDGHRRFKSWEEQAEHFAHIIYPYILRDVRPWWKHPRWHIRHWRLQVHPIQKFKRWAFSRCAGCGKRFKWGYSVTTTQWDSTGPLWFKSERNVYHSECVPVPHQVRKGDPGVCSQGYHMDV